MQFWGLSDFASASIVLGESFNRVILTMNAQANSLPNFDLNAAGVVRVLASVLPAPIVLVLVLLVLVLIIIPITGAAIAPA